MSRAWMVQLLLMPLFVISQETCSSVTCSNNPGDPGNARLGNDTTALLHFQVASTTTTTLPACVAEINTGDCNAMSACKCEPDINPQPIGDFPDTQGTLQCGGKLSCNSQSASNTNFFRMNTPSPLECSGQNSCQIDFNVENIGSMCVTGDNAVGPSSQAGTYKLADPDVATGRVNDVCCAREVGQNQPTCKSPTFENVGSFFCTGDVSCDNVQATLSGDFYCRSLQGCGDQTNPPNDDEYWQWTTSGKHCIRCQSTDPGLDQGSCQQADFQFPLDNSYPNLYCSGFKALEDTTHVSLLSHSASSKLRAMRTRTDEEFKAKKPWVDLGGTAASDRFFRTSNHISFVERPNECGDEGEQEARQICAKHLPNEASNQSEVFGDCIFDVCHGGGELDAELRADLMAA